MIVQHVQVVAKEAEDRRPRHAVLAAIDEAGGEYDLERFTLCRRLEVTFWELVTADEAAMVPFDNAPVADRCATCQALLLQQRAGLGGAVATFDAAEMHRPLEMLTPPTEETYPGDLTPLPE